jgi:hypothetical protein
MMAAPGVAVERFSSKIASTTGEGPVGTVLQPDRFSIHAVPSSKAIAFDRLEPKCTPVRFFIFAVSY